MDSRLIKSKHNMQMSLSKHLAIRPQRLGRRRLATGWFDPSWLRLADKTT
jgi:hypothetical protein